MRYFTSPDGGFYAVESLAIPLPNGVTEISEAAAQMILAAAIVPPTAEQTKNATDLVTAKSNAQLVALTGMSSLEIANHVNTKSTADPETKKILILLGIGLSVDLREKLK